MKDLLPDLPSRPAAVRTTLRSPQPTMVSETDLALWRDGRGRRRGQGARTDRVSVENSFVESRASQGLVWENFLLVHFKSVFWLAMYYVDFPEF